MLVSTLHGYLKSISSRLYAQQDKRSTITTKFSSKKNMQIYIQSTKLSNIFIMIS